jgi:hypothetical protein
MHRADNFQVPFVWKPGSLSFLEISGCVKACTGIECTYFLCEKESNYVPSEERLLLLVICNLHDVLNYFPQLCRSKLKSYVRLKCAAYVRVLTGT